jgi:hypothetical protein
MSDVRCTRLGLPRKGAAGPSRTVVRRGEVAERLKATVC